MTTTTNRIAENGVVGAGGAGFPTHVKLAASVDTLLINAAECEPLLHKDKEILRTRTEESVDGALLAGKCVGASRVAFGIKEKYGEVIETVRSKLGGRGEVFPLRDAYPAGDELILIHEATGRVVPPGELPSSVGVVVINVETAMNLATDRPVTEKYLTVAGAVEKPVTIRVAVGTTFADCIAAAGGATADEFDVIVGGVMMGRLAGDLVREVVDKTTGGLIVLPIDHPVVGRYRRDSRAVNRIGRSACDQCSFCTQLCPRWLLGHPIEPHAAMRNLLFQRQDAPTVPTPTIYCVECNLCSLITCPENLDPSRVCADGKARWRERGERPNPGEFQPRRADIHMNDRKTPTARLMQKLDLVRYNVPAPLVVGPIAPAVVEIPLRQHIGAPCEPCVAVGERVSVGQTIGRPGTGKDGKPALGAAVHASIAGTVTRIDDRVVRVEA